MGGFFINLLSENTMIEHFEHFEHKSYEEQIKLLESRSMCFENDASRNKACLLYTSSRLSLLANQTKFIKEELSRLLWIELPELNDSHKICLLYTS